MPGSVGCFIRREVVSFMISLLKSTRNIIRVSGTRGMRFSYKVQFSSFCDTHTHLSTGLLPLWRKSFHCKSSLHTHEVDQQHNAENRDDAIFGQQKSRRLRQKWPNSQFQTNCSGRRRRRSIGSCTKPFARSLLDSYSHGYSCEKLCWSLNWKCRFFLTWKQGCAARKKVGWCNRWKSWYTSFLESQFFKQAL